MRTLVPPRLKSAIVIAGLWIALAFWLHQFFPTTERPLSPQINADRLIAQNYLAGELTAPLPPSPHHWAQRLTGLTPSGDRRYGVAREAVALTLALCGGNGFLASLLASGAAAALFYLAAAPANQRRDAPAAGLAVLTLLAILRAQDWYWEDPFPFLVLGAASLFFIAWKNENALPSRRRDWTRAAGVVGLGLCAWELAAAAIVVLLLDHALATRRGEAPAATHRLLPKLVPVAILGPVILMIAGLRNHTIFGSFWVSPTSAYRQLNVTAPVWFWEKLGIPREGVDRVLERYDELVAIPAHQWTPPVYAALIDKAWNALATSGGFVLALGALAAVLLRPPSTDTRKFWLPLAALTLLTLLRYGAPPEWWLLLTPALACLLRQGLARATEASGPVQGRRLQTAYLAAYLLTTPLAPKQRVPQPHTDFVKYRTDIEEKILETPGRHLVFLTFDPSSDPSVEPAALPRNWERNRLLYARDLGPEANAALVAALPNHAPWHMAVYQNHLAVRHWSKELGPLGQPANEQESSTGSQAGSERQAAPETSRTLGADTPDQEPPR